MKHFDWVVGCAVVVCILGGLPQNADAQFGGGGAIGQPAPTAQQRLESAVEQAAPFMGVSNSTVANDSTKLCRCVGEADGDTVHKIKSALDGPVISAGMEFADQPLEEVVSTLQDDYDIPIQLDTPALDNAGIGPDEKVTVSLRSVSLKSALRLMLKQLQLTYIIQDEVLIITTPEEAESRLVVCVYDVRDLIGQAQGAAVKSLVDAIVSCVATETWAANGGGEAEIRPMPPNLLIVSQIGPVHDEIRDLLGTLREMRADGATASATIDAESAEIDEDRSLLVDPAE